MKTYFIQHPATKNIKIGQSENPGNRLKELQTGSGGVAENIVAMIDQLRRCSHNNCNKSVIKLRKNRVRNGAFQAGWWCHHCGRWANKPVKWLKKAVLNSYLVKYGIDADNLPYMDETDPQMGLFKMD